MSANRYMMTTKDMDGLTIRIGDRVLCLAMPGRERCLSDVVWIERDGRPVVDNGHIKRAVDPMSCILERAM